MKNPPCVKGTNPLAILFSAKLVRDIRLEIIATVPDSFLPSPGLISFPKFLANDITVLTYPSKEGCISFNAFTPFVIALIMSVLKIQNPSLDFIEINLSLADMILSVT